MMTLFIRFFSVFSSLILLSACASVVDGTSQELTIDSNPKGAECMLNRNDKLLARVTTPDTITIKKTKHNINVSCTMDGFYESTAFLKSKTQDSTWGNIVLGGGIGWAIDSASGADNKYDSYLTITMVPLGQDKPGLSQPVAAQQEEVTEQAAEEVSSTEEIAEDKTTEAVVADADADAAEEKAAEVVTEDAQPVVDAVQ